MAGNSTGIIIKSFKSKSHKKYFCIAEAPEDGIAGDLSAEGEGLVVGTEGGTGTGGSGGSGGGTGGSGGAGGGTDCSELIAATTGVYTNNSDTNGLSRHGIVLSTGNAKEYGSGPNRLGSFTGSYSTMSDQTQESGQIDLLQPIAGNYNFYDVTQIDITFDLAVGYDSVTFNVAFGSEEFQEFVGSQFKDAFGLYVNGQNIAYSATSPINIDHADFKFIQGTELDGLLIPGSTTGAGPSGGTSPSNPLPQNTNAVMQFTKQIGDGVANNTLTFIIADTSDPILDSTAYISGLGGTTLLPIDVRLETNPTGKPLTSTPTVVSNLLPGDTAAFATTITGTGGAMLFCVMLSPVI